MPMALGEQELRKIGEYIKNQRELMMRGFELNDKRWDAADRKFESFERRFETIDTKFNRLAALVTVFHFIG